LSFEAQDGEVRALLHLFFRWFFLVSDRGFNKNHVLESRMSGLCTGKYSMSIQLTIAGSGMPVSSQQELRQDRGSVSQARIRAEELKAAASEKLTAFLSENNNETDVRSAAKDLERLSTILNRKLRFYVDQESHEVIVKVIDAATDKVIKILPPEELRRLHSYLKEAIGFLCDEQA
jgi:flagellar protein FlaG